MSTTAGDREVTTTSAVDAQHTPGSAARAFLAWRTTAAAMLPVWIGLASTASVANTSGDDLDDIGWFIMSALAFVLGVLVIVPAFVFTVGRWLDRRTSQRGLGYSVATFALVGLAFGIIFGVVIGLEGHVTLIGIISLVAAPAIAAALGRLLCEVRGAIWSGLVWAVFIIALVPSVLVVGLYALSGLL